MPPTDRGRPGGIPLGRCAVVVAVVGVLGLGAPPAGGAASELRAGVSRVPASLDPWSARMPAELLAMRLLYQGLVAVGERGDIEPALATAWTVSRDGLVWTFRLRPDARLADGSPLGVEAVVAALASRVTSEEPGDGDPAWSRPFRGAGRVVHEVRRAEDGLQVVLARPYAPLLALLAHPALGIAVPKGDGQWAGSGPYRVAALGPGRLVLEAVPGWPGERPMSSRIVLEETGDDPSALAGLAPGGPLDVALLAAPPAWAAVGLQVVSAPTWRMGLLALRTERGLTSRKSLRQAVALALDPALVRAALGRWATPAAGWLPPGAWAAREGGVPAFDLARARRLLGQVAPIDPALTLLASERATGPEGASLAEALQISLGAAGFRVQVRLETPEAAALAARQGAADLVLHEAALDVNDPDTFLRPLLGTDGASPDVGTNVALLRSPVIDSLLTRAGQLGFRPERLRLYHRLQGLLADELPYVPLYVRLQWVAARPTVRGIQLEPSGLHRLERFWVAAPDAGRGPPPTPPAGAGAAPLRP
jgi:peptide/nickel transport system substrate-binding protein